MTVSEEDNRRFLNAVRWIAKTEATWRDLPERFGEWNSVYQRFNRWARKGIWEKLFLHLAEEADREWLLIDSTVTRAHQHAAGKKGAMARKLWDGVGADSAPKCT